MRQLPQRADQSLSADDKRELCALAFMHTIANELIFTCFSQSIGTSHLLV